MRKRHGNSRRRSILGLWGICAALCALFAAARVDAILSYPKWLDINTHVGADRFYREGYYGERAFIANVEAGHVWGGHEALLTARLTYEQHASITPNAPLSPFTVQQYDGHATAVGFTMVGLGPYNTQAGGYLSYQFGMAPLAGLSSTAIATSFESDGSFEISTETLVHGYRSNMETGVWRNVGGGWSYGGQRVDVVNSSWGFEDPAGRYQETMIIDALAYRNRQTVVLAAGNDGLTAPPGGPASGYNSIAVGALQSDSSAPPYGRPATFTSGAPADFYNPALPNPFIRGVRPAVDIVAPGTNLFLAAYTGTTGGNTGGTDAYPGQNDLYYAGTAGTSFSSPIVAGGAALLVDVGYDRFDRNYLLQRGYTTEGGYSVDGRVIKAVLLNSADKLPGWTNDTKTVAGVKKTTQGLDFALGAGALNLDRAFDQYTAGTTDVPGFGGGTVLSMGWDYGRIADGAPNLYFINRELDRGETFTATLDWFIYRSFDALTSEAAEVAFQNLDLQVWRVVDGSLSQLIAESATRYNNVQHLYFTVPEDGDYALRVLWGGFAYDLAGNTSTLTDYGLAWSAVPLPPALLAAIPLLLWCVWRHRRRARHA